MTTTVSEGPRTLRRALSRLAAAHWAAEQSALLKNSLALISGTVFSQAILFLCSPLLSRIFSRTDFGHLANYNAWVSILALLSSLRYEHAVIVANGRENTNRVVVLTGWLSLVGVFVYMVISASVYFLYTGTGYLRYLREIVLFLPIGVLAVCLSSLLIQLNVKAGKFKRLAVVAAIQVVITLAAQILLGLLRVPQALIIGTITGFVFSGAVFARWFFQRHSFKHLRREMTLRQLRLTATEHADFPRYTMAADAIGVVVQQFIPVFVTALFSPALAGVYAFSTRVVRVPLLVVASAISGALRKEAVDHVRRGQSLPLLFSGLVKVLCLVGLGPFVVLLLYGKQIFAVVFGAQWVDAGRVVQILSPGILFEFVAFPLSVLFLVTNSQRYTFRLQLFGFLFLVVALAAGKYFLNDFLATCFLVSGVMVIVNLASIVLASRVSTRQSVVSPSRGPVTSSP